MVSPVLAARITRRLQIETFVLEKDGSRHVEFQGTVVSNGTDVLRQCLALGPTRIARYGNARRMTWIGADLDLLVAALGEVATRRLHSWKGNGF